LARSLTSRSGANTTAVLHRRPPWRPAGCGQARQMPTIEVQRKANSLFPCPGAHQIGEFCGRGGLRVRRPTGFGRLQWALGELLLRDRAASSDCQVRPWRGGCARYILCRPREVVGAPVAATARRRFGSATRSHRRQRDLGVTSPDPGGEGQRSGPRLTTRSVRRGRHLLGSPCAGRSAPTRTKPRTVAY